jgi:hypothetical protein
VRLIEASAPLRERASAGISDPYAGDVFEGLSRPRWQSVPKPPPASIAGALTVPERLLLFCLASDTDWQAASITQATARHMMVRV